MILLRLLVLCSFLILTRARVKKPGRVDVDQLRHEFLEQEQRLWNFVADQTDNRVKETDLAEVSLIREFEQFGDRLHEKLPHDVNYGLQSLEGVWAYAYAYTDLRGIYALYETFRRFQSMQTGDARIPSPRQAWIDLSRAILDDPKNSINESIGRLHYIIEKKIYSTKPPRRWRVTCCATPTSPPNRSSSACTTPSP
jgi:hypothetical protein